MTLLPGGSFPLPDGTRKAVLILVGKKQITCSPGKTDLERVCLLQLLLFEKNRLSQPTLNQM